MAGGLLSLFAPGNWLAISFKDCGLWGISVRLLPGVLVLMAAAIPQVLAAQAPRTEPSAIQSSFNFPSPPSLQVSSRREDTSIRLDSRQTRRLLNFATFRTNRGQYALFGENEKKETPHVAPSSDLLFSNEAEAKTAFRPPLEQKNAPTQLWRTLLVVQHGAAVFDAWSTRDAIQNGGAHEMNPLFRPFAGSNLIYPATQVGSGLLDFLGYRMMKSKKAWVRKIWWVPQVAGTAASLFSGAHNLAVAQGGPPGLAH
jgi:hypothetical protein